MLKSDDLRIYLELCATRSKAWQHAYCREPTLQELYERRYAALERYRIEHEREHGPTCKTDDTGEDELDRQ